MAKKLLRNFLYLDDDIVDDYLSQLEGGLLEGPYTTKDARSGDKAGKAAITTPIVGLGATLGSSSSSEIQRTIRETPPAKFDRLYQLLRGEELIQPLAGFDQAIYDVIEPGEIVEVRGMARLPKWEHLSKALADISGLIEVMQAMGQDPLQDPSARTGYQGFSLLASKKGNDDTVLIVAPLNAPGFSVVAKLDAHRIRRRKEDLEAEITLLGKIQKVLARGHTIDAFRLIPELSQVMDLNRAQRRATRKGGASAQNTATAFDEVIKYPAIQVQPIAVYQ